MTARAQHYVVMRWLRSRSISLLSGNVVVRYLVSRGERRKLAIAKTCLVFETKERTSLQLGKSCRRLLPSFSRPDFFNFAPRLCPAPPPSLLANFSLTRAPECIPAPSKNAFPSNSERTSFEHPCRSGNNHLSLLPCVYSTDTPVAFSFFNRRVIFGNERDVNFISRASNRSRVLEYRASFISDRTLSSTRELLRFRYWGGPLLDTNWS